MPSHYPIMDSLVDIGMIKDDGSIHPFLFLNNIVFIVQY
jgi:hypothetical protein